MKKFYGIILVAYAIASIVAVSFLFDGKPTLIGILLAVYTIAVASVALYGLTGCGKRDKLQTYPPHIARDSRKFILFAAIFAILLFPRGNHNITTKDLICYGFILLICVIGFLFSSTRDPLSRRYNNKTTIPLPKHHKIHTSDELQQPNNIYQSRNKCSNCGAEFTGRFCPSCGTDTQKNGG